MTPFDIINQINVGKEDISEDPEFRKAYEPYIINKGLSYFYDTCLQANMMNERHFIPKKWQFHYLLNTITKKKRFSKWHKKDANSDDLTMVMNYYGYSKEKASVALSVLTDEQLTMIKQELEKGGKL